MSTKIEIETKEATVVTITDCEEVRNQIKKSRLDMFFMTCSGNKIMMCFTRHEEAMAFVELFSDGQQTGDSSWEETHTMTVILEA